MTQARIGIIGAGFWATYFYLPFLQRHPDARCVGIVRREQAGLAELQHAFDLDIATTNVEDLLAHGCDGIVVSSPHMLHRIHAEQALNAGAHVLVEKPMTVLLSDARALATTAKRNKKCLTVAHGWNYSRMALWAMDLVEQGAIGRITSVTGFMASALVDLFSGKSGYGTISIDGFDVEAEASTWATAGSGGGYLYGQLSHQLGLVLALLPSEPRDVFARTGLLPNDVDIDVTASVAFEGGTIASFSGTGRLPWGVRYPMELRLVGEDGVVILDFERDQADAHLARHSDRQEYELTEGEYAFAGRPPDLRLAVRPGEGVYTCDGPIQLLIDRCLQRDSVDRAPAELGVRSVAIMEAAERSARTGEPVRIDDLL